MGEKGKGYVFAAEAFMAVLVFILFFSIISNFFIGTTENVFSRAIMKRIAIDALDALDGLDVLETLDSAIIKDRMGKVMPERMDWRLDITQYSFSNDSFVQTKAFSVGNTGKNISYIDTVKSKRLFLTFRSGIIDSYNAAELWVWLK